MNTVKAKNISIVDAINGSKTRDIHSRNEAFRQGFFEGLKCCGWSDADVGRLIMDADMHQMNNGIDRPMCGGVWLDWEPEKENQTP